MEDSNILAKYIISDNLDYDEIDHIKDLEDYMKINDIDDDTYHFGDLVNLYAQYREIGTKFIGKNGELIDNPDYTDAGYLTIPYEITQYLKNATHKYRNIDYSIIELRHDDDFLEKNRKRFKS